MTSASPSNGISSGPAETSQFEARICSKCVGYYYIWFFATFLVPLAAKGAVTVSADSVSFTFETRRSVPSNVVWHDNGNVVEDSWWAQLLLLFLGPVLAVLTLIIASIVWPVLLVLSLVLRKETITFVIPKSDIVDVRVDYDEIWLDVLVYDSNRKPASTFFKGKPMTRRHKLRLSRQPKESRLNFKTRLNTIAERIPRTASP